MATAPLGSEGYEATPLDLRMDAPLHPAPSPLPSHHQSVTLVDPSGKEFLLNMSIDDLRDLIRSTIILREASESAAVEVSEPPMIPPPLPASMLKPSPFHGTFPALFLINSLDFFS